ncbi:hypothetical protein EBX31_08485, partial [bacterium]|nr:hypothetical protein [bacterium]
MISGAWTNSAAWTNGTANNAIFQGTVGSIGLGGTVYANQIQVNTTGFTIGNTNNGTTSNNRYFRSKNGLILGNGVNLNISSGITTNGAITGFQGVITNAVGATGATLTVTGTTLNADSSVRIGFDGSETDIWVPLTIATTGSGYASLKNVGGTNSIYGNVTVNSGSRLTLGAGTSTSPNRRINVRGNLTTVNTDLTIGESGDVGMIVLYGNNSIGGNVLLRAGQLGYGTNNTAFGSATIVISEGTSFGQQGAMGTTDADRTIANNLSLLGNVTMGLGSFSSYIGGNVDLNGAVRTVTLGNTTYFNGAVTNGGLTIASSSATRVLYLNGTNTLSSLSWTQGVVAFGTATNQIASLTMSNTTNGNPTLLVLNPTNGVDTRGAINLIGTNLVLALNNPSNTLSYGTYSLLKKGSSFNTNNLSPDGLSLRITHVTGSQTNVTTNQLNGPSVTYQKYIYTFTETANSLNLIADVNPSMDLTWSPGLVADWNTNSIDGLANPPWSNSGAPSAFRSGDNAIIDQGGTLNVDTNGITSSYVKVSGANDTTIQGGSVNALLVSKYDAGVLKLGGDLSSTQGIDLYGGTLQTLGDEDVGDTTALRFVSNNVTFRLGGNERVASLDSASTVTNALVDLVTFNLVLGSTNSNATNTFYGSIQGSGNVTKTGVNMQLLRGSNAFNNLIIEQGSLYVRGSNSIASNVIVQSNGLLGFGGTNVASGNYFGPSANLILSNGATLAQIATNGSGTVADRWIPNPIKIQGNVTFGIGTFANYYSGSIDLGGQVRTLSLSNSTYFSGIVSNGGLTVAPSTLRLYLNSSNTYGGGTTMQGAQISLGNNDGLGTGTLTVNASVSTNNLTVSANLTSSNPITLDPGAILELDSSSFSWTHSGSVGGSGSILKRGTGTLNLTGTLNYSGSTTVAAGNLVRTTDNISASITPSTIAITFSNTPANGTYAVLPGALSGMYTATYNNLSSSQKATFSTESPASVTVASKSSQSITDLASTDTKTYGAAPYTLSVTPGASSSSLTFSSDN